MCAIRGYYRQQFQKFQPKVSKATDYVIMSLLLLSYATVVSHKRAKNALLFLFQPCHITLFLLILLMLLPVTWIGTHIAFNVILCNVWGTYVKIYRSRFFSTHQEMIELWPCFSLIFVITTCSLRWKCIGLNMLRCYWCRSGWLTRNASTPGRLLLTFWA